jgi:hypothetical protein
MSEEAMSYDSWDQEYHLTPKGWVDGTYKYYGEAQGGEVARPSDAVETWNEHGSQASGWSSEYRTHSMIWHEPAMTEADRKALRSKFPSPFRPNR